MKIFRAFCFCTVLFFCGCATKFSILGATSDQIDEMKTEHVGLNKGLENLDTELKDLKELVENMNSTLSTLTETALQLKNQLEKKNSGDR